MIPVNASGCAGYDNYVDSSSYGSGHLRDAVGFTLPSSGGYRYSSRDGRAAMIRVTDSSGTTWLFVSRACIESQLAGHTLHHEND